ncbi:MAG: hypothetical protein B7Z10_01735 [Rhodobacterales bacterium 32-66-7]|nr:MAG: hypothetical protein B7Z31_09985 [Rhodobacterales bacterium 12-65-15]OYX26974.1 MAG: hypothetical protein B7Z10_01735 [Rhodobacterales bacterium 32-66-7]
MTAILRLSAPFTLWVIGFSALYGLHGITCSRHWPPGLEASVFLLATAIAGVAAQGLCLWLLLRLPAPSRFVQSTSVILGVAALVAAVWLTMPILATSTCS